MDTISDMLAAISNALAVKKPSIRIPASNFKGEILSILKKFGYINDLKIIKKNKKSFIDIKLLYQNNKPAISHLKKISKPGLRTYTGYYKIPRPLSGLGLVIISTPKGVLDGEEARSRKLGGELICEVY